MCKVTTKKTVFFLNLFQQLPYHFNITTTFIQQHQPEHIRTLIPTHQERKTTNLQNTKL
jgi:hypothetical protein